MQLPNHNNLSILANVLIFKSMIKFLNFCTKLTKIISANKALAFKAPSLYSYILVSPRIITNPAIIIKC